jgi:peptidoglycan/xylan/chitin deacetylase (PgdA/CDA1 family)
LTRSGDRHQGIGLRKAASWQLLCILFFFISACAAQKVAITFDDLPLNGDLPPGATRVQIARDVIAVLKEAHMPPAYGFVNAKRLEGNADAAEARPSRRFASEAGVTKSKFCACRLRPLCPL